tara:strand:- start:185 stop:1477 length:1293 start_codon:yes stop_codon:yes gene_type:complete
MKIAFHTLGCKLNFSETSFISNDLKKNGFIEVEFNEIADIYVINTCTVTENANKECQYLIRKVLNKNPNGKIVIMGCYAQLKPDEIAKLHGVNLILGNNEKFKLKEYLINLNTKQKPIIIKKNSSELHDFQSSFSFGNRTRSFLKIQDGCNYKCTFCTIPLARGHSRSGNIDNIIKNIKKLKNKGVKEIVLTGVNIGDFSTNNNEKFIDLLKQINTIKNIRIRISSIEPNLLNNEIIELVKDSKVLLPHFHIPLQSGSDTILKLMKRRYLTKQYQEVIQKINNEIPNACIGVDVIVGFPGEKDEYFNETLAFLKSLEISYLHVFTYSERENTLAIKMNDTVSKDKRKYRSQILRNLSDKKTQYFYQKNIGSIQQVLFESKINDNYIYGFSENYIKIKSKYSSNLENSLKKISINNIEYGNTNYAMGTLIN